MSIYKHTEMKNKVFFFRALETFRSLLLEIIEELIDLAHCYSLHEPE